MNASESQNGVATGIIWLNLIDGWPQISDAVVDYYLDKKLAYYYKTLLEKLR